MKIMFMGTPDFAVCSLEALCNKGHEIVSVVTTPDKPRGRGHKMVHTQVYNFAESKGFRIHTPVNLKEENFKRVLEEDNPDIIVVVAYGKLLPEYVLDFPKYGCVNVHGSLLPKYRGAAPIQRSIIDGEKITGVTTMYMAKGLDTGDMLLKEKVDILDTDNYETLHDKLADAGAGLIVKTLDLIEQGVCPVEKQDDSKSCYAHMITKETAIIDWKKDATDIHNLIRGLYPIPKSSTKYNGKNLKIGLSEVSDEVSHSEPGTVCKVLDDRILVACGNNSVIELYSLQFEGKKMTPVKDYLKGNTISENVILGE